MQAFSRVVPPFDRVMRRGPVASVVLIAGLATASLAQGRSIVDLQEHTQTTKHQLTTGNAKVTAELINLNPHSNVWLLLKVTWPGWGGTATYHLENPDPKGQNIVLSPHFPAGVLVEAGSDREKCALWEKGRNTTLYKAQSSGHAYVPICGGRVLFRNAVSGRKTMKEFATDFLRRHIWGGEEITTFVKNTFYRDKYLATASLGGEESDAGAAVPRRRAPRAARVAKQATDTKLKSPDLNIRVNGELRPAMKAGQWYPVKETPDTFISMMSPYLVPKEILTSHKKRVRNLDAVESKSLVYSVAFDLDKVRFGFEMGTEHPSLEWSGRIPKAARDWKLPGPDGVANVAPLRMTGLISPVYKSRLVGSFTGGFKRYHGAFRWGEMSFKNHGHHYGFMQNGVVLSKLQPNLSSFIIKQDGTIDLRTWSAADDKQLSKMLHVRQNGVPIIERDPKSDTGIPGEHVHSWELGNWSGSQKAELRTLRAGVCLQQHGDRKYLIYSYFTSVTPNAMARVFQAYNCEYAMHLDMNAPEHSYLSLFHREGETLKVQALSTQMYYLDPTIRGKVYPRFVGMADNRDFFYIYRK